LFEDKLVYKRRSVFPQAAYQEIFGLWDLQYSKSSGHPAAVLNDIIAEVDNAWSYHQDLMKRTEVLSQKLSFYRDNMALLQGGETNFGRDFFTVRGKVDHLGAEIVG
jgi:hypothetical protein